WHAAIESYLVASRLPYTLISPTTFADVLMLESASIRERGRWSSSAPHGRNALVDSADVVDAAVAVLTDVRKRGGNHVLTGPVAVALRSRRANEVPKRLRRSAPLPLTAPPSPR